MRCTPELLRALTCWTVLAALIRVVEEKNLELELLSLSWDRWTHAGVLCARGRSASAVREKVDEVEEYVRDVGALKLCDEVLIAWRAGFDSDVNFVHVRMVIVVVGNVKRGLLIVAVIAEALVAPALESVLD